MVRPAVQQTGVISLNSQFYHIKGPVRSELSSIYPEKRVFGDFDQDSDPRLSIWHMDDWRGGLGIEILDPDIRQDRFWWSTCNTQFKGHLILPRLATVTSNDPGTTPGALGHLNGEVYQRWGSEIYKYNNSTDTWGAAVKTGLAAGSGDFITPTLQQTSYIIHAQGTQYSYSSDGSSWSDSTQDVLYFTIWDDRLWGITSGGQLWWAFTPGTETLAACLAIEGIANGEEVTDLLTARGPTGEPIIYAATNRGLWAYDADNDRFVATELNVPSGLTNGKGTVFWRESIYYPAGAEIYRYIPGPQAAITEMGPGRDGHGLPDDQKGRIEKLVATHNELLALVDPTELSGNTGSSFSILAWSPRTNAWRCLHEHGTANVQPFDMMASNAYGVYRLWWNYATDAAFMNLPYEITNDLQTTDADYAASSEHITPWLCVADDVDAIAVRLRVDGNGLSANETIKTDYGLNLSSSWTTLGTKTTDGVTVYEFPDSTTPTGTAFRHIRFRTTLARGGTTTNTPDQPYMTFEFRKKLKTKRSHVVTLDLNKTSPDGLTPRQQAENLRTAEDSAVLVEFTHRDDTDADANFRYWVDIVAATGLDSTGYDYKGEVTLTLAEA